MDAEHPLCVDLFQWRSAPTRIGYPQDEEFTAMDLGMEMSVPDFKAIVSNLVDNGKLTIHFDSGRGDCLEMRRGKIRNAYVREGVLVIESGDNER
jgi:hypothetical protein